MVISIKTFNSHLPTSFWCGKEKIIGIPEHFSPTKQIKTADGKTDHVFTGIDYRTGEHRPCRGRDLMENGFILRIPARDAAAWIFEKMDL